MSADHLGTARLVTDQNGYVVARHDYLPFGEEIGGNVAGRDSHWGAGNDSINQKFTGKERDAESGLDYFGARYYGSALGRFTSPDWSAAPQAVPYAALSDPQTLNLYAYVRNNPLGKADADGHCCDSNDPGVGDSMAGTPFEGHGGQMLDAMSAIPGFGSGIALIKGAFDSATGNVKAAAADLAMALPIGKLGGAASRATELANAMGKTKDFVTVAVTETKEGVNVVSSSEKALRPAVSAMLKEGEVAATGAGHAEVTGVNAAKQMGLTPTGTAASRGICLSCAQFLHDTGVQALSALKKLF